MARVYITFSVIGLVGVLFFTVTFPPPPEEVIEIETMPIIILMINDDGTTITLTDYY